MPEFRPFSLGEAISQGQTIAGNQMRLGALPGQIQAQERINEQQMMINDLKLIKEKINSVYDQNSYEQIVAEGEGTGVLPKGTMPKEYNEQARNILSKIQGNVNAKLEQFGAFEPIPGMAGYYGQKSLKTGAYTNVKDTRQKDGEGGFKSADANAIYRRAAELFGGVFDQNGNLIKLDPAAQPKVLKIAKRAERYFKDAKGGMTHSEATQKAAQDMGIEFPPAAGEALEVRIHPQTGKRYEVDPVTRKVIREIQ